MSFIWTHIQFSEDVVDSMQKTEDFSPYERHMKLGTQMTNLINSFNKRAKKHGHLEDVNIHHSEYYDLLIKMIKEVKNKSKFVQAFVFGVITHYILEQKVRPYLVHLNKEVNFNNIKSESHIDTLIMKRTYNLETWKTPVFNEINVGLFIDKNIVNLLTKVNHPIAKHIRKTYLYFNIALRHYYDPYGWKTKLLPSFRPIYTPYTYSHSGIDYLNEYHEEWYNEATNEVSTCNFFQLYDEARLKASVILKEVLNYWSKPNTHLSKDIKYLLTQINKNLPSTISS